MTETRQRTTFFDKLRSCAEVDAYFRLASGTCAKAVGAGLLHGRESKRGRYGSFYVDPEEAFYGNRDKGGEFDGWGPK